MPLWVKKWKVPSFSGSDKIYTVSVAIDGTTWGCSCWSWIKNKSKDCKHIIDVKNYPRDPTEIVTINRVTVIPTMDVVEPIYDKQDKRIYVPLVSMDPFDVHMEATICYFLITQGFTIKMIREIRSLSPKWTKKSIVDMIKSKGMKKNKLVEREESIGKGIPVSTLERFRVLEFEDQ